MCVCECVSACAVMWVWWIMSLKIPRHWDFSTFKAETVRIGESDQPCCVHGPAMDAPILCERWCKCWGRAASHFKSSAHNNVEMRTTETIALFSLIILMLKFRWILSNTKSGCVEFGQLLTDSLRTSPLKQTLLELKYLTAVSGW